MRWIGQNIYDLISRFRSDVYLEDVSAGTIASGGNLGLDSNNKIVKATEASGDLTSIVAGTGLSGTSLTGPIPTLNVDASQTQITSVGTIGTGVWQGTPITTAYIGDDQVTEDKLANTLLAEIDANTAKVTNSDQSKADINALDITEVGTISSGQWRGDAIASAYIAGDAINGDKIADDAVDSEHYADGSIDTAHIADDQVTFAKASGVTPNVYGSTIKILPSDFMANDDAGVTKTIQFVDEDSSGLKPGNAGTELLAFVAIPEGMKITLVDVYASSAFAVDVIQFDVNASVSDISAASIGSGNAGTQINVTDTNSTATNFFMIQVTTTATSSRVFGGLVTIAAQ